MLPRLSPVTGVSGNHAWVLVTVWVPEGMFEPHMVSVVVALTTAQELDTSTWGATWAWPPAAKDTPRATRMAATTAMAPARNAGDLPWLRTAFRLRR